MADSDEDYPQRRQYAQPYTQRQPVPTISSYEDKVQSRVDAGNANHQTGGNQGGGSENRHWFDGLKDMMPESISGSSENEYHQYSTGPSDERAVAGNSMNHNSDPYGGYGAYTPTTSSFSTSRTPLSESEEHKDESRQQYYQDDRVEENTKNDMQYAMSVPNTAQNQPIYDREPPHIAGEGAQDWKVSDPSSESHPRTVTDPVTHLPVVIHDNTSGDIKRLPSPDASRKGRSNSTKIARNDKKDAYLERLTQEEINASNAEDSFVQGSTGIAVEAGIMVWCTITALFAVFQLRSVYSEQYWSHLIHGLVQGIAFGGFVGIGTGYWIKMRFSQAELSRSEAKQRSQNQHVRPLKPNAL